MYLYTKMAFYLLTCVLFSISLVGNVHTEEIPSVSTKLGVINGIFSEVSFKSRDFIVKRFLGIPYAKPPVGELRFKKPEPAGPLSPNPFPADKFGSPCAQIDIMGEKFSENTNIEDCLFLNIYVPVQEPDSVSGHAVMVFIHGGGYNLGTGNRYIADRLSSVGNVIVITINYRLWIWGFLDFNDERAPGNMGLWDQQMAFRWVHEHIESFGGDKDRVTIFGESAGAVSVGLQALYPENKGLFTNVISESGSPSFTHVFQTDNNIQAATFLAELLNCTTEKTDQVFDCIKNSDSEAMLNAFKSALNDPAKLWQIVFTPTVDNDFVKQPPAKLMKLAKTEIPTEVEFLRSLKLMNGLNGAEGAMWLFMVEGPKENYDDLLLTKEDMDNRIIPTVLPTAPGILKSLISSRYTDWKNPSDPKLVRKQFVKLLGDLYFNVPGIEFSLLHANGSNPGSYLYRFTSLVEQHFVKTPTWSESANHADELGPVFGYDFDYEWAAYIKGGYTPPDWEIDMSERMMTAWTNFAKYGNPNEEGDTPWPKYTIEDEHYLNIDREDSVGQYLHADDVNFWREIVPMVQDSVKNDQGDFSPFTKKSSETCDADGNCD
ncbi:cholinesterase-like [Mercenaria mercenaria]|uniref:cholinesterase-like n=1 Tax=Mercenaria mercenaria TaxID=6596 RepID=UPI00234EFCCC|nr:cholinesterase-like [Mercenaria mercenaria]